MKRTISLLAIGCVLLLGGCTTRPDASRMTRAQEDAKKHVQAARASFATAKVELRKAQDSHRAARESHKEAESLIAQITPRLDALYAAVPDIHKPEVAALRAQVGEAAAKQELTTARLNETTTAMDASGNRMNDGEKSAAQAEAKHVEIEAKLIPEYLGQVSKMAEDKANAQRNAVIAYMVAGVATLGCAVLGYLLLKP